MRQDWRPLTLVTQLGLTVVVSLVLSLLLGLWLDGLLGTKPILTLVFSLIGIAAGTVGVYRLITQAIGEVVGPGGTPPRSGTRERAPGPRPTPARRQDEADEDWDEDREPDDEHDEGREG